MSFIKRFLLVSAGGAAPARPLAAIRICQLAQRWPPTCNAVAACTVCRHSIALRRPLAALRLDLLSCQRCSTCNAVAVCQACRPSLALMRHVGGSSRPLSCLKLHRAPQRRHGRSTISSSSALHPPATVRNSSPLLCLKLRTPQKRHGRSTISSSCTRHQPSAVRNMASRASGTVASVDYTTLLACSLDIPVPARIDQVRSFIVIVPISAVLS